MHSNLNTERLTVHVQCHESYRVTGILVDSKLRDCEVADSDAFCHILAVKITTQTNYCIEALKGHRIPHGKASLDRRQIMCLHSCTQRRTVPYRTGMFHGLLLYQSVCLLLHLQEIGGLSAWASCLYDSYILRLCS